MRLKKLNLIIIGIVKLINIYYLLMLKKYEIYMEIRLLVNHIDLILLILYKVYG